MKMNKKITASILAMTMGAGLVGSISGTVAWYQYSTRAQLGMLGLSMGLDRNLEAYVTAANVTTAPEKNDTKWTNNITAAKLQEFLGLTKPYEFNPVTTNLGYAKDANFGTVSFRGNPIKYKTHPNSWALATEDDYLEFKVWVRAITRDGTDEQIANPTYVAQELGLYDARIQEIQVANKEDISSAVRVQINAGTNNAVLAKDTAETDLHGALDLDGDGELDLPLYYSDVDDVTGVEPLDYGVSSTAKGLTWNLEDEAGYHGEANHLYCDDPVSSETDPTSPEYGKIVVKGGFNLGATTATAPASFMVKIWLEGWAKLGAAGSEKAMWSTKDYVGSKFFVGLTVASGDAREAA